MSLRDLSIDDIESLAVGAWVLGTGGGGNPYLPLLNMRALYKEGHRVQLMQAADLADHDLVAGAGGMGAPLVGAERMGDPRTLTRAVLAMEAHIKRRFTALMSVEIGGGNGVRPLMAAALMKLPVVDSDPMGRAYPEGQMTSTAIGGLAPCPISLVDVRGLESIVHSAPDAKWTERVARKICVEYGSTASMCTPPRTGAEIKKWGIHGTTTKAIRIGEAVRRAQRLHEDAVAAVLAVEPGVLLFRGKVIDVARRVTEGYLRGVLRVDGVDEFRGAAMRINFQNEWIVAWRDEQPLAMTPDLICVLDSVSGEAVGSETIRYGQRVTVIALPPPAIFLTPKGLEHVGPRAFGYDLEFRERVRMSRRTLSMDDIESLALGAWILGTGGGGNPYLPLLNMRALYKEGHRIQLMDAADLADDNWVGTVANMGAPLVGQERLIDSLTLARAVTVMEKHIGKRFAALMSMEIGGANGVRPLMAAAHLDRPIVDSDTMARAYPELQMTSVAIGGLKPCPVSIVDVRGFESIVHEVPTWKWAERVARKFCTEYGASAATCQPPRTGAEVKQWGIHGTVTKAMTIGAAVREAQRRHDDPIAAILAVEPGKLLFRGKVTDVQRRAAEGWLRGVVRFDGFDDWRGSQLSINFQNEWIVSFRDGAPLAMTPDLICVLNSDTGEAVGSETIRYGQRVTVIALPPPDIFLSPKGLEHVGPRAFGYDLDFRSVFSA